jgi:hypothetical protein
VTRRRSEPPVRDPNIFRFRDALPFLGSVAGLTAVAAGFGYFIPTGPNDTAKVLGVLLAGLGVIVLGATVLCSSWSGSPKPSPGTSPTPSAS